jgi:hypothetical protein
MIDYRNITVEQLNQEHPQRSFWLQAYLDYELLYKGGLDFKRAAGRNSLTIAAIQGAPATSLDLMASLGRRRRFLFQLEGEPDVKYISRWERCYYIPYAAAIIDYFRHWLFSSPPNIRPRIDMDAVRDDNGVAPTDEQLAAAEAPEAPDWFDPFMRDCTGSGTSFHDLGKQVFGDVLLYRKAGWVIATADMNLSSSVVDTKAKDRSPITLTAFDAKDILDWQEDTNGKLEWILLRRHETCREFPAMRREVETRLFLDRDSWGAWEVTRDPEAQGDPMPVLIDYGKHNLGEVPFEWMTLPDGMWIMNKLAAWQVDLFNQMSMLSYSQLVACFPQPYIKSAEGSESATTRIMGEGIILQLRAGGDGNNAEEFGWAVTDTGPLEFNAKRILEQRDEGYRIVHQMALAVDSQAIGAIARSGASKIEDRKAAEIMLCGYGGYLRDFQLRTLDKISRLMGDDTEWVVEGYDSFEISSLMEELQTAGLLQTFQIKSPTFNAEMEKSIATGRVLNHADEAMKAKIRNEIQGAYDQLAEQQAMGPPQIDPLTGKPIAPDDASDDAPDTAPAEEAADEPAPNKKPPPFAAKKKV